MRMFDGHTTFAAGRRYRFIQVLCAEEGQEESEEVTITGITFQNKFEDYILVYSTVQVMVLEAYSVNDNLPLWSLGDTV